MQVNIIAIIPTYKILSKDADAVVEMIVFVIFIMMLLNVIVTNKAIASLFPIFVLSICNPFNMRSLTHTKYSYILFTNM